MRTGLAIAASTWERSDRMSGWRFSGGCYNTSGLEDGMITDTAEIARVLEDVQGGHGRVASFGLSGLVLLLELWSSRRANVLRLHCHATWYIRAPIVWRTGKMTVVRRAIRLFDDDQSTDTLVLQDTSAGVEIRCYAVGFEDAPLEEFHSGALRAS